MLAWLVNWLKTPYRAISLSAADFHFLGEPSGSGLQVLKDELSKILATEGNTVRAYLTRIQYRNEDRIRIAVVISTAGKHKTMATAIARECQPKLIAGRATNTRFRMTLEAELCGYPVAAKILDVNEYEAATCSYGLVKKQTDQPSIGTQNCFGYTVPSPASELITGRILSTRWIKRHVKCQNQLPVATRTIN